MAPESLLPAALETCDEMVRLALSPRPYRSAEAAAYAALPGARALSLLAAVVEHLGAQAPPWAMPATIDRMRGALAMPQCPSAVHAAAAQALHRLSKN